AVTQFAGRPVRQVRNTAGFQPPRDFFIELVLSTWPEPPAISVAGPHSQRDVVCDRQLTEQGRTLERAPEPQSSALPRRKWRGVATAEADRALGWSVLAGDDVEQRRLPRSVGT